MPFNSPTNRPTRPRSNPLTHPLSTDQRRLQCRQKDLILGSRAPQHPTVVARIVRALLLRVDLGRSVRRLAQRERLQPRTHVLWRRDAQLLVALTRASDGDPDHVV